MIDRTQEDESSAEFVLKLWDAVDAQQTATVRELLRHAVNMSNTDWLHALNGAISTGNTEIAELLLSHGADPNFRGEHEWSCLTWAVHHNSAPMVKCLLDHGADVNAADSDNHTALYWAVGDEREEIVKVLLDAGADTEVVDTGEHAGQQTVLHRAAVATNATIVTLLLAAGANPNRRECDGKTALHLAVHDRESESSLECVRQLVAFGAEIDARDEDRATPLHDACLLGPANCVAFLVEHGANISARNVNESTPLIQVGNEIGLPETTDALKKAKILLGAGANIDDVNDGNRTALAYALQLRPRLAHYLITLNARVDTINYLGGTTLFPAAAGGDLSLITLLIEKGVDVNHRNHNGETAEMIARQLNQVEAANFLALQAQE